MSDVGAALRRASFRFDGPTLLWGASADDAEQLRRAIDCDVASDDAAAPGAHTAWPVPGPDHADVVIVLPKARAAIALAARAASAAAAGTRLWAVGPLKGGAGSAGRTLADAWDAVEKVDSARHCVLWGGVARGVPFDASEAFSTTPVSVRGERLLLCSAPGVFCHGAVDDATSLLINALAPARPGERILDLGCGSGVIGAWLASTCASATVLGSDTSALAAESARRTFAANGLGNATARVGHAWDGLSGLFDRVVTNPPFHEGRDVDLTDALAFIDGAFARLAPGGELWVVANRFLPYLAPLERVFGACTVVVETPRFRVYRAARSAAGAR